MSYILAYYAARKESTSSALHRWKGNTKLNIRPLSSGKIGGEFQVSRIIAYYAAQDSSVEAPPTAGSVATRPSGWCGGLTGPKNRLRARVVRRNRVALKSCP